MPSGNELMVSWADLHRDTRSLVARLLQDRPGQEAWRGPWKGIVAITRGGMIPAAVVAREMDIRLIDTLAVASYQGQTSGPLTVLKEPDLAAADRGKGWLVVDDIVDTGRTLEKAREILPDACLVTLYAKPRAIELVDIYIHRVAQDRWVNFPWDTEDRAGRPVFAPPMVADA